MGEIFLRVWDLVMSPARRKSRARAEADKAVAEHDEKAVNELLDKNL
jgi:hypothetical protein